MSIPARGGERSGRPCVCSYVHWAAVATAERATACNSSSKRNEVKGNIILCIRSIFYSSVRGACARAALRLR